MPTNPHPGYLTEPEDDECPQCGGSGVIDDECTCGDDTCCCLVPEPPECPECQYRMKRGGP